eukprot:PhM_4_TR10404/c0_g1_i1/m.21592
MECYSFATCNACVLDGYDAYSRRQRLCSWNASVNQCTASSSLSATGESTASSVTCVSCPFASIASNVYICEIEFALLLSLNIVIALMSIGGIVWAKTLAQRPWTYDAEALRQCVARYFATTRGSPNVNLSHGFKSQCLGCFQRGVHTIHDRGDAGHSQLLGADPQKCVWCLFTEVLPIPIVVSMAGVAVSMTTLLTMSLPPSFAVPFYIAILTVAMTAIMCTVVYAIALLPDVRSGPGVQSPWWHRLYLDVALVVAARRTARLATLLGTDSNLRDVTSTPSRHENINPDDESTEASPIVDTNRPLADEGDDDVEETDFLEPLPQAFCLGFTPLDDDETIVWWEKPRLVHILQEKRHILQTLFFISMMLIPIYLTATHWGVHTAASVFLALFFSASILIAVSCDRAYVLTTRRCYVVSRSILWRVFHCQHHDLAAVSSAYVTMSYISGERVASLSFGQPAVQGRRLPPLPSAEISCLRDTARCLHHFTKLTPPLTVSPANSTYVKSKQNERLLWMLVVVSLLFSLPVPMYYRMVFGVGQWMWVACCLVGLLDTSIGSVVTMLKLCVIHIQSNKTWSEWRRQSTSRRVHHDRRVRRFSAEEVTPRQQVLLDDDN